jgi:hypothetical protein
LTKRVIALAWAVDPLALSVAFPPQVTFTADEGVVVLPPVAVLSLPHADNITAPVATTARTAPNRLIFNSIL